jgi:hypothetical protein
MEEDAQQRITFLLQEIDANICAAHRSATQICSTVRRHHQILRQIHEASQVWRPLFESFAVQPAAAKRPAVTPGPPPSSARPSSPARSSSPSAHVDNTTRNLSFSDDETEPDSIIVDEQTFKTTTLRKLSNEGADESLNVSINSDGLPSMARTPYMNNRGGQSAKKAPAGLSMISANTSNWTPDMSSPPKTDILKVTCFSGGQIRKEPHAPCGVGASPCSRSSSNPALGYQQHSTVKPERESKPHENGCIRIHPSSFENSASGGHRRRAAKAVSHESDQPSDAQIRDDCGP